MVSVLLFWEYYIITGPPGTVDSSLTVPERPSNIVRLVQRCVYWICHFSNTGIHFLSTRQEADWKLWSRQMWSRLLGGFYLGPGDSHTPDTANGYPVAKYGKIMGSIIYHHLAHKDQFNHGEHTWAMKNWNLPWHALQVFPVFQMIVSFKVREFSKPGLSKSMCEVFEIAIIVCLESFRHPHVYCTVFWSICLAIQFRGLDSFDRYITIYMMCSWK